MRSSRTGRARLFEIEWSVTMDHAAGPGVVTADDVGLYTIANTVLLDSRFTMAYAAGINDCNPAYFDDLRPGGLQVHPGISFSLQWASRFRPDQKHNPRAAPMASMPRPTC